MDLFLLLAGLQLIILGITLRVHNGDDEDERIT